AEDNAINQQLAVGLLERRGHAVVVVGNGREALLAIEKESFDLVLMDVQMPEMDGFMATAAIREREMATGSHLPIIAMTAHAMKGDRERCLEAGMDGYVSKPIRSEELFKTIENLGVVKDIPKGQDVFLDVDGLLEGLNGDRDLLIQLIELFPKDCSKYITQVREAIAQGSGEALNRAAHALKGAVGIFSTGPAFEIALRLEKMGEQGDLTGVSEAFESLEKEIERLMQALTKLKDEKTL
ncbi:response regulator, partial [Deltaproteobacteria bacterium TL4]